MTRSSAFGNWTGLPTLADAADITQVGTTMADQIEKYVIQRFANAAARDAAISAPAAGMRAYVGAGKYTAYDGSTWYTERDSGTYTPTLVGLVVGTGGTPINSASFTVTNGVLVLEGTIKFGTAGQTFPAAGEESISLPSGYSLVESSVTSSWFTSQLTCFDVSGAITFGGGLIAGSATTLLLRLYQVSGANIQTNVGLGAAVPMAWAASDEIGYRLVARVTG